MSPWILFILLPSIYAIGNPRYECGDHGRFEYCIDGFPGCIVGCHCHPGYYFDTETKICEPNAKLVEEYRRLYVAEPTRVPLTTPCDSTLSGPTPTSTTTATESVTRDTDDLGDWLYNQFFKTIETQVINNTDKSNILTRRSGSDPVRKPKRLRRYKSFKGTSKRAKKKNDDLRRKLLRITEDDSLFDSTFDSDSGDSSSYSESMSIEENPSIHIDKKDHDQRKLIIFNKKPKMPLPSFVFLPNYDTPFYPPLGLPVPPPMPMYPMVPVPPMPAYPCPGPGPAPAPAPAPEPAPVPAPAPAPTPAPTPAPADATTQSTTTPTEHTTTDSETMPDDDETIPDNEVTTPDDGETNPEDDVTKPDDVIRSGDTNRGKRKKLLQKLRQRMRPSNIKINMTPPRKKKKKALRHHVMEMKQEPEIPYTDDYMMDPFVFNEATEKSADEPVVPAGNDVDFKYLAQLIHRVDPNLLNSKDLIKNRMQTMEQAEEKIQPIFGNHPENRPTRRMNGNRFLVRPNDPDDPYYTNLGQQIAGLIRKLDSTGHRHVDIEVDPKHKAPGHPVFNENNFASRSYWERSVRSPLENIPAYTDEDYPQTNYRNLLNIENKVENVATTIRTFSLNDLENVVNLMDRAKLQLRRKNTESTKQSKDNLNVNLLPRLKERVNNTRIYSVKELVDRNNVKSNNKTSIIDENIPLNPYLHGVLMNNFKHMGTDLSTHDLLMSSFGMIPDHDIRKNPNHTSIKDNNPIPQALNSLLKRMDYNNTPNINHIRNASMISHILSPADIYTSHLNKPTNQAYQLAPLQKYKNTKYYHDENKHYVYEKESIPLLPQGALAHTSNPIMPSYFHHEVHHFDYFE